MLKFLEKEKAWKIGLLQALLVTVYCASLAAFINYLTRLFPKDPPGLYGFFLMMLILVFSAATTGSLVFGYPTYLGLVQKKIKEALQILAFTLLSALVIIAGTIIYLLTILS